MRLWTRGRPEARRRLARLAAGALTGEIALRLLRPLRAEVELGRQHAWLNTIGVLTQRPSDAVDHDDIVFESGEALVRGVNGGDLDRLAGRAYRSGGR